MFHELATSLSLQGIQLLCPYNCSCIAWNVLDSRTVQTCAGTPRQLHFCVMKNPIGTASDFHAVLTRAHRFISFHKKFHSAVQPVYQRSFPSVLKHAGSQIQYLSPSLVFKIKTRSGAQVCSFASAHPSTRHSPATWIFSDLWWSAWHDDASSSVCHSFPWALEIAYGFETTAGKVGRGQYTAQHCLSLTTIHQISFCVLLLVSSPNIPDFSFLFMQLQTFHFTRLHGLRSCRRGLPDKKKVFIWCNRKETTTMCATFCSLEEFSNQALRLNSPV